MTTTVAFQVHAIPAETLQAVRDSGTDVSGYPVERLTAAGAEPLRCCLRTAREGEALILFGYEPPLPPSPYREIGAVFAHAQPCDGPAHTNGYPPDWYGRPQVVRGYDKRGWIQGAVVHDGTLPEEAIATLLDDPDVVQVHSRNVGYGCYMFAITRP